MIFKELVPYIPVVSALVKAILEKGKDPAFEIPRITRSYEAAKRGDKAIDEYLDGKFPE